MQDTLELRLTGATKQGSVSLVVRARAARPVSSSQAISGLVMESQDLRGEGILTH